MKKALLLFLFILPFLLINVIGNNKPVVSIENAEIRGIGKEIPVNISLNSVPNGFSGYNITISLSNSIANITEVHFPDWAILNATSSLPSSSVWIKAVDLGDEIKAGDTNITLATIVLQSHSVGKSFLNLSVNKLDDDKGYPIQVSIQNSLIVTTNHPPEKPSNPYPADGSSGISINPTLHWRCFDKDNDALTYDVYFGINQNPPKIAGNITEKSFNPGTLQYSTTYYWKIVAWDEYGAKNESKIWQFTTQGKPSPTNIPPSVSILSPVDGSMVSGNITIEGIANDRDGMVKKVEVKIDNGLWKLAIGTTSWKYEWYTTSIENGNHTIYARSYDGEDYSSIDSVNVKVFNNHPPSVAIISPVDGEIVKNIVFINGTASDKDGNETIQKVEIKIGNGSWMVVNGTTLWSYKWDSVSVNNGKYIIKARAYDGMNYSSIDSITVEVKNKKGGTPGFEMIAFIVALISVIWIMKKKNKN